MERERQLVSVAFLGLVLCASPALAASEHGTMLVGEAFLGVDFLGRVVVAVDTVPTDEYADHYFLYTAKERLAGPWSRHLERVQVLHNDKDGALTVAATDRSFLLSVAVHEPIEVPHPEVTEVFSDAGGLELASMVAGESGGLNLDSLSMTDLASWPEPFRYDVLAPESGPCQSDADCQAGGKDASSCSISCPPGGSCSTTCGEDSYACCRCIFGDNGTPEDPSDDFVYQQCRCRVCITGA